MTMSFNQSLRVMSFNVCRFRHGETNRLQEIADSIQLMLQEAPHVIVSLNEVVLDTLKILAKHLGMSYAFGQTNPKYPNYGNAILAPLGSIISSHVLHLDGGSVVNMPFPGEEKNTRGPHRIARGLLHATIQVHETHPPVHVLCTHLDHLKERERVIQVKHILEYQAEAFQEEKGWHVLVGDLNALDRRDYDAQDWNRLVSRHHKRGWVPPEHSAGLDLLKDSGYIDAFDLLGTCQSRGLGLELQTRVHISPRFTAHVDNPVYRIDYAYFSKQFVQSGWHVAKAWVETRARGSDHFPIVVDLVQKPRVKSSHLSAAL